jgi:hypothetical protein
MEGTEKYIFITNQLIYPALSDRNAHVQVFTTTIIIIIIIIIIRKTPFLSHSSNAGIVGSDPTQGMDVCVGLLRICAVLCVGSGLAMN